MEVVLNRRAERQLDEAFTWWAKRRSAEQAARWYRGFLGSLLDLEQNAASYPLAPENHRFPFEVRQMLFGLGSRPTHRALFTIRPNVVLVFSIRHLAQRWITLDDL